MSFDVVRTYHSFQRMKMYSITSDYLSLSLLLLYFSICSFHLLCIDSHVLKDVELEFEFECILVQSTVHERSKPKWDIMDKNIIRASYGNAGAL